MVFSRSLFSSVILLVAVCICVAACGCIAGHRFPATDIVVSKYNSDGETVWSTTIDNSTYDHASDIIETPDGGFAIAGSIDENHGMSARPRVVRLNSSGKILWDRTLEISGIYSVEITNAADGGFITAISINNHDSGEIVRIDAGGQKVWNRTFDSAISDIIPAGNDRFALAGSRTLLINGNGTILCDMQVPSSTIIHSSDGAFYVGQSGVPYSIASVYRFDRNGTAIWHRPVGNRMNGKITSLVENSLGDIEVVYTYEDPERGRDLARYMESDFMTIGKDGNITDSRTIPAVDPVCRTAGGGFVFLAYPFSESQEYTTIPHDENVLHLVRLSTEGLVVDDRSLDVSRWTAPRVVLPTRDGGIVTLIVNGA